MEEYTSPGLFVNEELGRFLQPSRVFQVGRLPEPGAGPLPSRGRPRRGWMSRRRLALQAARSGRRRWRILGPLEEDALDDQERQQQEDAHAGDDRELDHLPLQHLVV